METPLGRTPAKKKAIEGKPGRGGGGRRRGGRKPQTAGRKGAANDEGLDFGPALSRRGLFQERRPDICPVRNMMYGHGDVPPESIQQDTADLVEDIVIDFCSNLLHKAVDQAALRGTKLQPEDVMFLLRKDPRKFARCKELLKLQEELKQARKTFMEDEFLMNR